MDIQKILDDLDLIEQVITDYPAGRRKGLTDDETEKAAGGAVTKAINALEELQEQNEVLADTVNMLSPLLMGNRELKEKQIPHPPEFKVHPKYPNLGIFHYCKCGVMFPGWGNPRAETNYCGNCGQKLKGESE